MIVICLFKLQLMDFQLSIFMINRLKVKNIQDQDAQVKFLKILMVSFLSMIIILKMKFLQPNVIIYKIV
jgi:hypothetical protein